VGLRVLARCTAMCSNGSNELGTYPHKQHVPFLDTRILLTQIGGVYYSGGVAHHCSPQTCKKFQTVSRPRKRRLSCLYRFIGNKPYGESRGLFLWISGRGISKNTISSGCMAFTFQALTTVLSRHFQSRTYNSVCQVHNHPCV
jgi:hypothetical protein